MSRAQLTSTVEQNTGGAVSPYVAGKNAVINGGFDIWQRGISGTSSGFVFVADRWVATRYGGANWTFSQATCGSTLPNFLYCGRVQSTAGQTAAGTRFFQSLESQDSYKFAGKIATFSFYARAGANYSGTSSSFSFAYGTGVDQNIHSSGFTNQTNVGTVNLTTSNLNTIWQRYSVTGLVPSNATQIGFSGITDGSGVAGAADYIDFTGVQLEIGSVATPFSRAGGTLSGELAACQRYYWRSTALNTYSTYGLGYGISTTNAAICVQPPVPMRVAPTSVDFSNLALEIVGVAAYAATTCIISGSENGTQQIVLNVGGASGLTQFRPYSLHANNTTSSFVGLSAEL
jgi:hypothetical protein